MLLSIRVTICAFGLFLSENEFVFAQQQKTNVSDFKIKEECLKKGSTLPNPHCDHDWALRNGNSLNFVHQHYMDSLVERVKNASDLSGFYQDGICLNSEDQGQCVERLQREALNSKIQIREETLKYNKGRLDMLDERVKLAAPTAADTPVKNSVLNDLYKFSRTKNKIPYNLLSPQSVSFDTDVKDPVILEKAGKLKEVENVPAPIQDLERRRQLALDERDLEIEKSLNDTKLNKKLEKALKDEGPQDKISEKKYKQDVLKKKRALADFKKKKLKQPASSPLAPSEGMQTLEATMDAFHAEALKESPGKGLAEAGDKQLGATPTISYKEDGKKTPQTLDEELHDLLASPDSITPTH